MKSTNSMIEVIGYKEIEAQHLAPHPVNTIGIGQDELAALGESIAETGEPIHDLLVTEDSRHPGKFLILDGAQRWRMCEGKKLRCKIIKTHDPMAILDAALCAGRRRTVGQRILMYIARHRDAVMKEYRSFSGAARRVQNLKKGQYYPESARAPSKSVAERIAALLRCDHNDCLRGLELEDCIERKVQFGDGILNSTGPNLASASYVEGLVAIRAEILSGETGIRHWKAAFGGRASEGKSKTSGEAGIKGRDIGRIAERAAGGLKTAFLHWTNFDGPQKDAAMVRLREAFVQMPDDGHICLKDAIAKWPEARIADLQASLRDRMAAIKSSR